MAPYLYAYLRYVWADWSLLNFKILKVFFLNFTQKPKRTSKYEKIPVYIKYVPTFSQTLPKHSLICAIKLFSVIYTK